MSSSQRCAASNGVGAMWGFSLLLAGLIVLLTPVAHARDTVYYYYTNTLHSAVVETDAQGNIVEPMTYYAPYGQVLNRSLRDGPGYTAHEEDPETGLSYMQQRYYDPQSGRFLSTDPVLPADNGGNFNRYWYANDNPYRYTDPDGRESGAGYATGEYTIALPPSSPEAREAALTMGGVVVVAAAVTGADEAVGAGVLLRAGIRYAGEKIAGAVVRQTGEKVVANLAKNAVKDDVKGSVRQIVKNGGEKQFQSDAASAMKGAKVKTVPTDRGPVQVGTHSDGSTVSARSFSSSNRPTIQVEQPNTSVTTKVRYDKDQQ